MADAYQILSDCPNCLVEGAVVEIKDSRVSEVASVEAKCRLCGREEALGQLVFAGCRFDTAEQAHRALCEWAEREGEANVNAFCESSMGGMDARTVVNRLLERKVVETNFDVMAHLFFGMSQGAHGRGASDLGAAKSGPRIRAIDENIQTDNDSVAPSEEREISEEVSTVGAELSAPGLVARTLSAVMVVDGQIRLEELQYVSEILIQLELPALVDDDVRSWRPEDLPTPRDPLVLLRLMIRMGGVDGALDQAEWRVIREFGRSWGVSSQVLAAQRKRVLPREKSQLAVLWRGVKSLVVSEVK